MYVVAVGKAVALKYAVGGYGGEEPTVLRFFQSGDYFGELALMSNQPRSATVVCQGPVTCFTIGKVQFETLRFSANFAEVLRKGAMRAQFGTNGTATQRALAVSTQAIPITP